MTSIHSTAAQISRNRGRPHEFDMGQALDKAMLVFCERCYHATSITQLISTMELVSVSAYKAFKDKRAMFLAVYDCYKTLRDRQGSTQ